MLTALRNSEWDRGLGGHKGGPSPGLLRSARQPGLGAQRQRKIVKTRVEMLRLVGAKKKGIAAKFALNIYEGKAGGT